MERIIETLECCICNSAAIIHNKVCPICFAILCSDCLELWIDQQSDTNVTSDPSCSCPLCRTKVNEDDWIHDKALQKVIDIIELPCPWCETQIRVDALKSHFTYDCSKFPLHCIFENCSDEIPRDQVTNHESECVFRPITCKCEKTIPYRLLQQHLDSWCSLTEELEPLKTKTEDAIQIAKKFDSNLISELEEIQSALSRAFLCAIVGEFNSGKTMFINRLLNSNQFKVTPKPTTALPVIIRHSNQFKYYKQTDPSLQVETEISQLEFETFSCLSDSQIERPYRLVVEGPILQSNAVQLMDTRGVGEHGYSPIDVISQVDATILLVDSNRIHSDHTQRLFRQIVGITGQIFVIINKCDILDDSELEEIQQDAYSTFEGYPVVFISSKSKEEKWKNSFVAMTTELNKFLRDKPVKGRHFKYAERIDKIYREMTHLQAVQESDSVAVKLINDLINLVIKGYNPLESAIDLASRYEVYYNSVEQSVDNLIRYQMFYSSCTGFVTGLGGLFAMLITVPSAIGARLAASIAHLYGHDVRDPSIQEVIILCLLNEESVEVLRNKLENERIALKNASFNRTAVAQILNRASTVSIAESVIQQTVQKAAKEATRKAVRAVSRKVYRQVVKESGKELARQSAMKSVNQVYGKILSEETAKALGQKLLGKVSYGTMQRALPLVSGAISGMMDLTYCRKVGLYAKEVFKQ